MIRANIIPANRCFIKLALAQIDHRKLLATLKQKLEKIKRTMSDHDLKNFLLFHFFEAKMLVKQVGFFADNIAMQP